MKLNILSLTKIIERERSAETLIDDYGTIAFIVLVLVPFILVFFGFFSDAGVTYSIVISAVKYEWIAWVIAVLVAAIIQLLLYRIPVKASKNLRKFWMAYRNEARAKH